MAQEPTSTARTSQTAAKQEKEETPRFIVSSSPHALSLVSIPKIMYSVILSLLPAALVGIYFFGWLAFWTLFWCIASSILTEYAWQRLNRQPVTIADGSAGVTGLLLGLTMPPGSPWWLCVLGGWIAIVLGKQIFGGLGYNPFNPALVARVFLLIAFPVEMTTWPKPNPLFLGFDAETGATPLGEFQVARLQGQDITPAVQVNFWDLFVGNVGGSLGETSALALLLGGAYLLYKQYITWHIPVSMVGTVLVLAEIFHWIDPSRYPGALFHLLTGGLLLGAIYMATDMVTCPVTARGQLLFGFGCGFLTFIIRSWGGYPEGVSFAIVLMNITTPLIDRYIRPKPYGKRNQQAAQQGLARK